MVFSTLQQAREYILTQVPTQWTVSVSQRCTRYGYASEKGRSVTDFTVSIHTDNYLVQEESSSLSAAVETAIGKSLPYTNAEQVEQLLVVEEESE